MLSEEILIILREYNDLDKYDSSMDEEFNNMDKNEVFEIILEYNGFIGWDSTIKDWISGIYDVELD